MEIILPTPVCNQVQQQPAAEQAADSRSSYFRHLHCSYLYPRAGALLIWHPVRLLAGDPIVGDDIKLPRQVCPRVSPLARCPNSFLALADGTDLAHWLG